MKPFNHTTGKIRGEFTEPSIARRFLKNDGPTKSRITELERAADL